MSELYQKKLTPSSILLPIQQGSNPYLWIDQDNVITFDESLDPHTKLCWLGVCKELSEIIGLKRATAR